MVDVAEKIFVAIAGELQAKEIGVRTAFKEHIFVADIEG